MSRFRVNNNEFSNSFVFSNEDSLKCQIKQIAIKCEKKIEHFSFDIEEFRFYVSNYLVPYIYYDPIYWYINPLTEVVSKHIGNEISMCFLYELEVIENNPIFNNAMIEIKKKIENVLLQEDNITNEEAYELLKISILCENFYPDLICNYLIGKILEGKLQIDSDSYQILFFRFANLFKKRNELTCYFTKGIFEKEYNKNGVNITDAIIKVKNGTYRIIFNEEMLYSENILNNLRTFFHEIWHFLQKKSNYNELYYRELFIMDTFLAKTKGEYGNNNYEFMSDEADAFLNENILLYQFLVKFSKQTFDNEKENILKLIRINSTMRESLERRDQFGHIIYLDEYFEKIAKMYKINPYRDLGLIYTYNCDGRRLRPLELFKKMEKIAEDDPLYSYYKKVIFNSNYDDNELPIILKELKTEIDNSTGNYLLLIQIYWIYVKQYLSNIRYYNKECNIQNNTVKKLVFA